VSLINELMDDAELHAQIKNLVLQPSKGGRFEVTVDDNLVFSKASIGRHAQPGEVYSAIKANFN